MVFELSIERICCTCRKNKTGLKNIDSYANETNQLTECKTNYHFDITVFSGYWISCLNYKKGKKRGVIIDS